MANKNLRAKAAIQASLNTLKAKNELKADFMEPQVFEATGLRVDTAAGTYYIPELEVELPKGEGTVVKDPGEIELLWPQIQDYVEVFSPKDVYEVEEVHGWFGRYSAPGYLDATDYVFADTEEECRAELEAVYGLQEEEEVMGKKKTEVKAAGAGDAIMDLELATEELAEAKKQAGTAKTLIRKKKMAQADDVIDKAIEETTQANDDLDSGQQNVRIGQEFGASKQEEPVVEKTEVKAAEENPFEKKDEEPKEDKGEAKEDKKEDKAEDKKEDKKEEKGEKKEKKSSGGTIEIVKDGEVIDEFPDAFGDDSVAIIKFFRTLYNIDEKADKKAAEKEPKKEEKGEKLEDKPLALPKVEEPKEPKADKKEEAPIPAMAPAAQTENFVKVTADEQKKLDDAKAFFEKRIQTCREIVAAMVEKNHVVAEQNDIDAFLIQGKSFEASIDEALKASADRKFKELLSYPDAELLTLRASLPSLKMRTAAVDIQASKETNGGQSLMELSILASAGSGDKKDAQFSIGAAFGGGFF